MENNQTKTFAIVGVIGSFSLFFLALISWDYNINSTLYTLFFWSRVRICITALLVILFATKIQKGNFPVWQEKKYSVLHFALYTIILLVSVYIMGWIVQGFMKLLHIEMQNKILQMFLGIFKSNPGLILYTSIIAGITEELIFRGYILPQLIFLLKNIFFAIVVSALLFSFLHFGYNSVYELVYTFTFGILFAAFYYKYRNIKMLIVVHFLYDFIALSLMVHNYK